MIIIQDNHRRDSNHINVMMPYIYMHAFWLGFSEGGHGAMGVWQ